MATQTKTMTADQMALHILLGPGTEAQKQAKLTALAKQVKRLIGAEDECPECGGHDLQDNGDTYYGLTYCCLTCGHQWQAVED